MPNASLDRTAFLGKWFTGIRRQGLLALLAPEVWHTLSAVLSFTSRDGSRRFGLNQLAATLGVSREDARLRLSTLAQTPWQGAPLVKIDIEPDGEVHLVDVAPIEGLAEINPAGDEDLQLRPYSAVAPDLERALLEIGLNPAQIQSLCMRHPEAAIRRQVTWLPARGARNPAALLIRAIEQDWDEPKEAST